MHAVHRTSSTTATSSGLVNSACIVHVANRVAHFTHMQLLRRLGMARPRYTERTSRIPAAGPAPKSAASSCCSY